MKVHLLTIFLIMATLLVSPVNADERDTLAAYFTKNVTQHKMVLDRESDKHTVSIAATGFGYYAWTLTLDKPTILAWINESLDFIEKTNVGNHGWLYHWQDENGSPKFNKEVSSIDTCIFYLCAQASAAKLGDAHLMKRIDTLVSQIDTKFMMNGHDYFCLDFIWLPDGRPAYSEYYWCTYSEGVILYKFFNMKFQPISKEYDLPLFVYYYPLCFYSNDEDFVNNLDKAVEYQLRAHQVCGITACDGPHGYTVNNPEIVSPVAIWAASYYSKEAKDFLATIKLPPTTPSYNRITGQVMQDKIGIDYGSCLMIISKGH